MAQVKNSFLSSKMNKDLDDRLIPNGQYRNAVNVSINKSTGENVGTAQTVLGNEQVIDFSTSLNAAGLDVIGVFPDEASNTIYAFLTNNTLNPYIPTGAVGNNVTYPNNQSSITNGPIEITVAGASYTNEIDGTTTAVSGSGTGLTVSVTVDSNGAITEAVIQTFGSGYAINDIVQINGGDSAARLTIKSLLPNNHFIVAYNITTTNLVTICQSPFLNFSTLFPITGINLLEELLFFTDNRNQPRKVNVTRTSEYYTTEDQISVAKYYPYETIELYQPSEITGAITHTGTTNSIVNSNVISFATGPAPSTTPSKSLGVTGIAATLLAAGQAYSTGTTPTEGGSGSGLTINILSLSSGNGIATFSIVNEGVGYSTGDIVTVVQGSSSNTAELTISVVKQNTFITDVTNWPNSITVSQTQDLPAGTAIRLSEPETTMQDAISDYLPIEANAGGQNAFSIGTSNELFSVAISSYTGDSEIIGANIFLRNANGDYIDTNTTVVSKNESGNNYNIVASAPIQNPNFVANAFVRFAIPNPYFDQIFKNNANVDFLSDKFVRFSYRYRFDDGEYSLIAPFTQPCFIPEQDGYFKSAEVNGDGVNDNQKAYRSTEISFMENKVNKIILNIPLPSSASNLSTNFKVTEIDILYKESDQTTIKVVDSVPLLNNVQGTSEYYQYEYGSKPPFKTLPQRETVRVSDKVPVKALSQEIVSNRVIYGNFQDKHTPPSFLNYTLSSGAKGVIGATTNPSFTINENKVTNYTSLVEYPNANLKQNRTYEVGVVLADRFGRQSTVVFSRTRLSLQPSFIASSRYSPYRTLEDNESTSTNPTGGILNFDGDSLKIQFIDIINSFKNETTGVPGLYNGDSNSQDYNPLGWYSFKIVVKQTEQEYYNVYIPTAMAAYPLDRTKEINTTSHIVLYNDNINKIPRDLQEVGPTQKEFPSSVRMFGRVNNFNASRTGQFYPGRAASLSTTIATIKDLFDFQEFPDLAPPASASAYVFYNYDYTGGNGSSVTTSFTTSDGSSLVARIESSNDTRFGQQVPLVGYYTAVPSLNVFETAPTVSLLDIYYETSTAGRIDLLNKAVAEGPAANIFVGLSTFSNLLREDLQGLNSNSPTQRFCTTPFKPLNFSQQDLGVVGENTCDILSVTNQAGGATNEDNVLYFVSPSEGVQSEGIFGVEPELSNGIATGRFRIVLTKAGSATNPVASTPGLVVTGGVGNPESYIYTFNLRFTNPAAAEPFEIPITLELENKPPPPSCNTPQPGSINVIDVAGGDKYTCCCAAINPNGCAPISITNNVFNLAGGASGPLFGVTCQNGSKTASLNKIGMVFSLIGLVETVGQQDITYGPAFPNSPPIATHFTISQDNIPTLGTLSDQQAIISVPQQNSLLLNTKYVLLIQAQDSGDPNLSEVCEITFSFTEAGAVKFDGDSGFTIVTTPVLSDYYVFEFCDDRWWFINGGQSRPIPSNAATNPQGNTPVFFGGRIETRYAPVKISAIYTLYNAATTQAATQEDGFSVSTIFDSSGYSGIPTGPALALANGIYPTQNGLSSSSLFSPNIAPFDIPVNGSISHNGTNTLTLEPEAGNIGWGQNSNANNFGISVTLQGNIPGGCDPAKRPAIQIQFKAEAG